MVISFIKINVKLVHKLSIIVLIALFKQIMPLAQIVWLDFIWYKISANYVIKLSGIANGAKKSYLFANNAQMAIIYIRLNARLVQRLLINAVCVQFKMILPLVKVVQKVITCLKENVSFAHLSSIFASIVK